MAATAPFPVTIRLLDPPLHEFLPNHDALLLEIAELKFKQADPDLIAEKEAVLKKIEQLAEVNPMLGHRGCRLGITHPEIYLMQAQAIFEAMVMLQKENIKPQVEIEIPLVMDKLEFILLREKIIALSEDLKAKLQTDLPFIIGTIVELQIGRAHV